MESDARPRCPELGLRELIRAAVKESRYVMDCLCLPPSMVSCSCFPSTWHSAGRLWVLNEYLNE